MLTIDKHLKPSDFRTLLDQFWKLSGQKIALIEKRYDSSRGSPVYTVKGRYTTRGWTEWTQGFQYGSAILQFDATGDKEMLRTGRDNTVTYMAPHVSHTGVHDHGFNNVSTYGNLLRLMTEGRIPFNQSEKNFYELALKISGAVQASRWTPLPDNGGFIHSFNGPHSLFVDTIRSCRVLVVSHQLGHSLMSEGDQQINLLQRALQHIKTTANYSIYYGEGRDQYDEWGRTAHESIFNTKNGAYRCPNSQQGYSGYTTWTRGLAWAMLGFAEELEFLATLPANQFEELGGYEKWNKLLLKGATATCDWYIKNTPTDGIPYWDGGAPNLAKLNHYLDRKSDPCNAWEPIDSSAAAIGAQGLLRLGRFLRESGHTKDGKKYWQAGLTVTRSLFSSPYLSKDPDHEGLILHSIYHRPNGWDYRPENCQCPQGESSMWGDYHARELALYLQNIIENKSYYTFFGGVDLK